MKIIEIVENENPAQKNSKIEIIPLIFLFVPLTIFAIFLPPGIVRYFFALPLQTAILFSLPFSLLFVFFSWKVLQKDLTSYSKSSWLFLLCFISLALLSFHQLYNPSFNGLVTVGGGDSGNHIFLQREFELRDAKTYKGFITFYTLNVFLSNIFNLDFFRSYRAIFYFVVFVICLFPAFFWSHYFKKNAQNSITIMTLASLCTSMVIFTLIINPILHYNQSDGFFPHIFSIFVPLYMWFFHFIISKSVIRFLLLALLLAIYRFSYGLNIADLFIYLATSAIVELLLTSSIQRKLKIIYISFAVSCLICAGFAIASLLPIIEISGAIVMPKLNFILPTLLLSGAVLIILAREIFSKNITQKSDSEVWFRFAALPVVMSICAVLFVLGIILFNFKVDYYTYKYLLHAQLLSSLALASIIPCQICKLFENHTFTATESVERLRKCFTNLSKVNIYLCGLFFICALSVLANMGWVIQFSVNHESSFSILQKVIYLVLMSSVVYASILIFKKSWRPGLLLLAISSAIYGHIKVASVYLPSFVSRVSNKGPWRGIGALSDREANRKMNEVLDEHRSKFGGYIVSSWPQSNFMNASFDFFGQWSFWTNGTVKLDPGYCAFWADASHHSEIYSTIDKDRDAPVQKAVLKLRGNSNKECFEYQSRFDDGQVERLCWVCAK